MNTTHTPGPWKVMDSTSEEGLVCLSVWPAKINEGEIGSPICKISPKQLQNDTDVCNASLIAAAPELLDIARMLYREIRFHWFEAEYRGPNEVLLSKATSVFVKASDHTVFIPEKTSKINQSEDLIKVIEILWRHTNKLTMNDDDLAFVHNTLLLLQLDKVK